MGEWDAVSVSDIKKKGEWDQVDISDIGSTPGGYAPAPGQAIDTRTSLPVPTSEEEFESRKNLVKTLGPIAGDIALTALMPQFHLLGKAPTMLKMGKGLVNLSARAGASAGGSALGSMGVDKLFGDPVDTQRAKEQALLGAGGEIAGTAIATGVKKIVTPILRTGINAVADFTKIGGMAARQGFKKLKRTQAELIRTTTKKAIDFSEAVGAPIKSDVGSGIGEAIAAKQDWDAVYKAPNTIIKKIADSQGGVVPLDDAAQFFRGEINEIMGEGFSNREATKTLIEWLGFLPKSKEGRMLTSLGRTDLITPENANYIIKKIWKSYNDDPLDVIQWKEEFKKVITDDLTRYGTEGLRPTQITSNTQMQNVVNNAFNDSFSEALAKSDKIYAATNAWFRENPVASKIIGELRFSNLPYYKEFPERVVDKLMDPKAMSSDQLSRIRTAILSEPDGNKAWAGLELNFVKKIFDDAIAASSKGSGKKTLRPSVISDAIYDNEKMIKAINPDLWPKLRREAEYYEKIAPDFETIDTADGMSLFEAFGTLHPKTKTALGEIAKYGFKYGIAKPIMHMGGEEVGFGAPKPQAYININRPLGKAK